VARGYGGRGLEPERGQHARVLVVGGVGRKEQGFEEGALRRELVQRASRSVCGRAA